MASEEPTYLSDARRGDIQSVKRCSDILRLTAAQGAVRAADVAKTLDLQKSTAHRYLASMTSVGLLARGEGAEFVPGPVAVHLGASAMRRAHVLDVAMPYLSDLAREAHETVVLSLWGGSGAVVSRVVEDDERVAVVTVREGRVLPLDSAQTVTFLAFLGDEALVTEHAARLRQNRREDLLHQVEQARRRGFGTHSNLVQGIQAVAAPVFGPRTAVAAVIAVVGTSDAWGSGHDSGVVRALVATAARISARLGHDGKLPTSGSRPAEHL